MTKANALTGFTPIGSNVYFKAEGDIHLIAVDYSVQGVQTKGSQGFNKKGDPKQPNEMVGSTSTYTPLPVGKGKVMLHYIRPMDRKDAVKAKRTERALNELEDTSPVVATSTTQGLTPRERLTLAKAGITLEEAERLAIEEDVDLHSLLVSLQA